MEVRQSNITNEVIGLHRETTENKMKTDIMAGIIVNLSEKVKDLENKIEKIELNNMRKCVVVTGFETTRQKSQCINDLQNFFEAEMQIFPSIEDIFFLVPGLTSPLVMTLSTVAEKLRNLPKCLQNQRSAE